MRYNYTVKNNFGEYAVLTTPEIALKVFDILKNYSSSCQVIKIDVENHNVQNIIAEWDDSKMKRCDNCFYGCYPLDGEPCCSCSSKSNWKSEHDTEEEEYENNV